MADNNNDNDGRRERSQFSNGPEKVVAIHLLTYITLVSSPFPPAPPRGPLPTGLTPTWAHRQPTNCPVTHEPVVHVIAVTHKMTSGVLPPPSPSSSRGDPSLSAVFYSKIMSRRDSTEIPAARIRRRTKARPMKMFTRVRHRAYFEGQSDDRSALRERSSPLRGNRYRRLREIREYVRVARPAYNKRRPPSLAARQINRRNFAALPQLTDFPGRVCPPRVHPIGNSPELRSATASILSRLGLEDQSFRTTATENVRAFR